VNISGSYIESGHSFCYAPIKEPTKNHAYYIGLPTKMKSRSSNFFTTLQPFQSIVHKFTMKREEKIESWQNRENKDKPHLVFGDCFKYGIPVTSNGQSKLWISFDQSYAKENYIQTKNGICLWKGIVNSNEIVVKMS
jgi:hypothetical protein